MRKKILVLVTFVLLLGIFMSQKGTKPAYAHRVHYCSITIGPQNGKGYSYGLFVDTYSREIQSQPITIAKRSDFILSTSGPCEFVVYEKTNHRGRFVILGTDLSKPIRAGIDGVEARGLFGNGNTWQIRSLVISYVPNRSCELRIGGNGVRMTYYTGDFFNLSLEHEAIPAMNRISYLRENHGNCRVQLFNSTGFRGRSMTIGAFDGFTLDPGWRVRSMHIYNN